MVAIAYYLDDIDCIGAIDYVPNTKDVAMARVKTVETTETYFLELSLSPYS